MNSLRPPLVICIAVLALNALMVACGAIAFNFAFRGEWLVVLLALPVVAICMVLQPWIFVLWLLVPIIPFKWALYPATAILSAVIYIKLERQGRLDRIKWFVRRIGLQKLLIRGGIAIAVAVSFIYARYRDFPALMRQPPSIIANIIKREKILPEDSYSYTLYDFLDAEYIWQARLTPQEFARLKAKLGVKPVRLPQKHLPNDFFHQPPYWWHPAMSSKTEVYATPYVPVKDNGDGGVDILLIWHPETELVNLWLKSKF